MGEIPNLAYPAECMAEGFLSGKRRSSANDRSYGSLLNLGDLGSHKIIESSWQDLAIDDNVIIINWGWTLINYTFSMLNGE